MRGYEETAPRVVPGGAGMGEERNNHWRIEMLGGLRATRGEQALSRFHTRKTASLLAYLAYHAGKGQPREVLAGLLWPDVDYDSGRKSLNVALSSLRRLLEPPGVLAGSVLETDSFSVRLNAAAITTDVGEFAAALHAAESAADDAERKRWLTEAAERCQGALLPGYYDDWIAREQQRLSGQLMGALRRLADLCQRRGELEGAVRHAQRGAALDPLDEEARRDLMRLLAAAGQNAAALRGDQELERRLRDELRAAPSPATRALADNLRTSPAPTLRQEPSPPQPSPSPQPATSRSATSQPEPAHPPSRLPVTLTRFIGREEELSRLAAMLAPRAPLARSARAEGLSAERLSDSNSQPSACPEGRRPQPSARLVTLTGPGGSGKTRLALEAASQLREAFGDAVWFVPLTDLTDAGLVPARICEGLQLIPGAADDPLEQVVDSMGDRPALLVLDNFEQLPEGSEAAIRTLLIGAPSLACLVTSRRTLNVGGEHEFPVAPLPVPVRTEGPRVDRSGGGPVLPSVLSLSALSAIPSVQLFVDRAQMVRPDFALTESNKQAVAQLCARLEGIPLAIELAAARAPVLTPAQMLGQLEQDVTSLVSRQRDAEPRHRTLRATTEWSYRLLPSDLQRFLAALSVFRGGWTLAAAEATAGVEEWKSGRMEDGTETAASTPPFFHSSTRTLDALHYLRDCSLILAEEAPDGMRFRMLEMVRQYAEMQLGPEEHARMRRRHREWFLTLADDAETRPHQPSMGEVLDRLEREHANFRAALEWCHGDSTSDPSGVEKGLALASHLGWFWSARGHTRYGRECLTALLSLEGAKPRTLWRARALNALGALGLSQGEGQRARPLIEEGLAIGRELGNPRAIAHALACLAVIAAQAGDFSQSRAFYAEALAIKRQTHDTLGLVPMLLGLGRAAAASGDEKAALAYYEEGAAVARQIGDYRCAAVALEHRGILAAGQGDDATARVCWEQALEVLREIGEHSRIAGVVDQLGRLVARGGDYSSARALMEQGLSLRRELDERPGIAASLEGLGTLAVDAGNPAEARCLLLESLSLRREAGETRGMIDLLEAFASLAASGSSSAEARQAIRLAAAAEALRESLTYRRPTFRQYRFDRTVVAARGVLGDEAFRSAWEEGEVMPLPAATAVALADGSE